MLGVRSDDGPREIEDAADLVVNGTEGMLELLAALMADVRRSEGNDRGCGSPNSSAPRS